MPVTSSVTLAAEVKALYDADYLIATQGVSYWDQFAYLRIQMNGQRGSTYEFPIVESQQPSTAPLDEVTDVSPQAMRANAVSITLQEFGAAIQVTKFLIGTSYTDVLEQAAQVNGYNAAESFDFIARTVFGTGTRSMLVNRKAARVNVDGQQTAASRLSSQNVMLAMLYGKTGGIPLYEDGTLCTVVHPFVLYDLQCDPTVQTMSQYQREELLFNGELAMWNALRFVVSNNAKVFWGAGAAAAVSLATTLAAAADVGATNLKLTSVTGLVPGMILAIIDATEPANSWSDTNEGFYVTTVGTAGAGGTGVDGFVIGIGGPGDNNGLRYAHASGKTVNNSNSVYPIPIVGPNSVGKIASDLTGPYGTTVVSGPFDILGRFLNFGWHAMVGYGRIRNSWLFRYEVGSSQS